LALLRDVLRDQLPDDLSARREPRGRLAPPPGRGRGARGRHAAALRPRPADARDRAAVLTRVFVDVGCDGGRRETRAVEGSPAGPTEPSRENGAAAGKPWPSTAPARVGAWRSL